jgi:biotin-[acetyl-CoA-carboxylase] ligase BirA-like protein
VAIHTNDPDYGATLLPGGTLDRFRPYAPGDEPGAGLLDAVFGAGAQLYSAPSAVGGWRDILARDIAPFSQYDALVRHIRGGGRVPDMLACVAGAGTGFHGFRGRAWNALPGNIHLTVHFAPDRSLAGFDTVFTAFAAVAVTDAINALPGFEDRARIKWVNDVLLEGRKVAGVLAWTQTRGSIVSDVVLGIGLNVEATPAVERSPFVPAAASLTELAPAGIDLRLPRVLHTLLVTLHDNYRRVLDDGTAFILERYRERSAVLGEVVTIHAEEEGTDGQSARVLASGRVEAIGDGLELHVSGHPVPVTRGRLRLGEPPAG